MLVKLNANGQITYFPGWIEHKDKIYTNAAAEEIAQQYGWKPLVTDETPPYDEETQYLDIMYVEETDCVRQMWVIKNYDSVESGVTDGDV